MGKGKVDFTKRIHVLLLALGLALIVLGLVPQTNEYSILLTSVGGIFFGHSFSWLTEEYYKKKDERKGALELFKKSILLFQATQKSKFRFSKEKEIKLFRKNPLQFYCSTKSEDGKLFWNYTEIAFTEHKKLGRLITTTVFKNLKRDQTLSYDVELFREHVNDKIVIAYRPCKSKEPLEVAVFESCISQNTLCIYGFLYHVDWSDKTRLSPAILYLKPLPKKRQPGPVSHEEAQELQRLWNDSFKNDPQKAIFEEYL